MSAINGSEFVPQILTARNASGDLLSPAEIKKLTTNWQKLITKEFNSYVKTHTQSWFGAKFSKKWTPFKVGFNAREKALYIWGLPPNTNVNKSQKKSKRIPWPKTSSTATHSDHYHWYSSHFHRVFIPSSDIDISNGWFGAGRKTTGKGFWFTAKKKWSGDGTAFFSTHSHRRIEANQNGYKRIDGTAARRYPFPAKWTFENDTPQFDYHYESVSDKLMADKMLVAETLQSTFEKALAEIL